MLTIGDWRSGAQFDDARMHRHALWRKWDESRWSCAWIGLNPSTADDKHDDPTIRKCCGFAKRWGFGGIVMLNLYSHISTDPRLLDVGREPMEANDIFTQHAKGVQQIVCAWGANKHARHGIERVRYRVPFDTKFWCLGMTQNGEPKHPLYVPYSTELIPFDKVKAS